MTGPAAKPGRVWAAGKYPQGRFVRLSVPAQPVRVHHFALTAAEPGAAPPTPDAHGALARITDPARAARVAAGVAQLIAREHEVLTWLEADPRHTMHFLADPAAALRQALGGLPPGFFDDWKV